jgi:mycothiol synthase
LGGPVRHFGLQWSTVDLPDGLTQRPLRLDDAEAVFAVMVAQEQQDLDEVMIELADIVGDWSRPSFDVAASTVGVFEDDRLVAYGEIGPHGRCDAAVHPDLRGRGIGTAIARWMQELGRSSGLTEIGMPVPRGSAGDRLLEALGYRVRWESWGLELPAGVSIPDRPLPEGYALRVADPADYEQCWTVTEDAFLEWSERVREPYDEWIAGMTGRPGFEPWHLRVVVDPADDVVSFCWLQIGEESAFIARLATKREERGRGLAQALLVDAFAVAREHGATRSELSTDSRTGALGLYEKVGMVVTSTWVNRGIAL